MEEQRSQILNGNLRGQLFKFSSPAIIGMLVSALYNIVDTLFVGRGVGPLGISALTIVMPIQLIIMAVGIMVGIGSASIISRSLGAANTEKALKTAGTSILLNLILSTVLMVISYIFIDQILYFFGASAETLGLAKDYMSIILIGFISFSFAISSNNLIRAEGKPRAAMYSMLIGAICNIILDPVFIFGLKMGVKGVAIATIISQFISAAYIISFFKSSKSIYNFRIRQFSLNPALSREIIAVGFPSFALQVVGSAVFLIFNRSILHYGNNMYIAVMGIGLRVLSLIEMPIIGIAQGFSTLVSFNYGAKKYERVKTVFKEATIWTIGIAGLGFLLLMAVPSAILGIFTNNATLIQMGVNPLRIIVIFLPFIGFQVLGGSFFQAIGKTVPSLIIILSRQLLLLIPALIVLPLFFELMGVWLSIPVSNFFAILMTFFFVWWQFKKFNEMIKERDTKIFEVKV
ncbi:MAG: MATE family efflux transporter [Actinobacteria bacterium]|nr:MATE family efflux transporter [Actinomycetota bacterium]